MCLAVPAQVIELESPEMARVRIGESSTYLSASIMLLEEAPKPGDYVIVHAGFALQKLSDEEARDTLAALREMAEAACGVPANF